MNILYDERVDGALPKVDKAALLAELQAPHAAAGGAARAH